MSFTYGRSSEYYDDAAAIATIGGAFPFPIMPKSQVSNPPRSRIDGALLSPLIAFPLSTMSKAYWLAKSFDFTFNLTYSNAGYYEYPDVTYSTSGTITGTGTLNVVGVGSYVALVGGTDPIYGRLAFELAYGYPAANNQISYLMDSGTVTLTDRFGSYTRSYDDATNALFNWMNDIHVNPDNSYPVSSLIAYDNNTNIYYSSLAFGCPSGNAGGLLIVNNTPVSGQVVESCGVTLTLIVDGYSTTIPIYLQHLPYTVPTSITCSGTITYNFNNFLTP